MMSVLHRLFKNIWRYEASKRGDYILDTLYQFNNKQTHKYKIKTPQGGAKKVYKTMVVLFESFTLPWKLFPERFHGFLRWNCPICTRCSLHDLFSLIAFNERVTFWLQRVRSLPCACAYVTFFACTCRLVNNYHAIAQLLGRGPWWDQFNYVPG